MKNLLVTALIAITPQMFGASISSATVQTFNSPPPDFCTQTSSGAMVFCQSSAGDRASASASATFGNVSVSADADNSGGGEASATANASYKELVSFGNFSGVVTGHYTISYFEGYLTPGGPGSTTLTIKQGDATFTIPPVPSFFSPTITLTSAVAAGVPIELSANVRATPNSPGRETGSASVFLADLSAPFVIVTPEPSPLMLSLLGSLLIACGLRAKRQNGLFRR